MGNLVSSVRASSLEVTTPLPPISEDEKGISPFKLPADEELIKNPGSIEELHKKTKDVIPATFDGARIAVSKPINQHFQLLHTISFMPNQSSGYRFGATYVEVDTKKNPQEPTSFLNGEIDPSGNLNANIVHQFSDRIKGKFQAQLAQTSNLSGAQGVLEYKGNRFTSTFTGVNIDLVSNSGVLVGHHLHAITPRISLGAELACQYGRNVPGGSMTFLSLAGRYAAPDYAFSAVLGSANIHLCYYHRASDELQLGVELDTKFRMMESVGTIAYQADIPRADFSYKASVDTNWTVSGVFEKKLQPLPVTLSLSGSHNHVKNQFQLGLGFIVG